MPRIFIAVALLMVSSCGTSPTQPATPVGDRPSESQASAEADVSAVPASLPFVTLTYGASEGADVPLQAIFENQESLDRFHSEHPGVLPRVFNFSNPLEAQPPVAFDFKKYRGVLFRGTSFPLLGGARIVSVEEQPDRLLIHTARWLRAEKEPRQSQKDRTLTVGHFIAVPRSDKPLVFAPTMEVATGSVRWRAVPNPLLTQADVEAMVTRRIRPLTPESSLRVEKRTLDWISDNLLSGRGSLGNLTTNSEVWVVIGEGQFGNDVFMGGAMTRPTRGTLPPGVVEREVVGFSRIVNLHSIEDGRLLGASAKPIYGDGLP